MQKLPAGDRDRPGRIGRGHRDDHRLLHYLSELPSLRSGTPVRTLRRSNASRRVLASPAKAAKPPLSSDSSTPCILALAMSECPIKIELLKDIQTAMGELMSIHNNEVVALLAEDFERVAQLKTTLQAVRERKARLIEEYREHVMGHQC